MRYILLSLGILLIVIFAIVIFTRGGSRTAISKEVNLSNFVNSSNGEVQYIVDGPIVAKEKHQAIRISITPTSRTMDVISGYQGTVVRTKTYGNDSASYSDFIAALNRAGFSRERHAVTDNFQSICPTSNRSTYLVIDNAKTVMKSWSASCTAGSFAGNITLTSTLFNTQIPDYSSLAKGVNLAGTSSVILF